MKQHPHRSTTHRELFYHFVAEQGQLIGKVNKPGKAMTVFVREEPVGNIGNESRWIASYAVCNPNDNFCRATGRTVARRRYFLGQGLTYFGKDKPTYEDIVRVFV